VGSAWWWLLTVAITCSWFIWVVKLCFDWQTLHFKFVINTVGMIHIKIVTMAINSLPLYFQVNISYIHCTKFSYKCNFNLPRTNKLYTKIKLQFTDILQTARLPKMVHNMDLCNCNLKYILYDRNLMYKKKNFWFLSNLNTCANNESTLNKCRPMTCAKL
jgi:hypothetical protein